MPFDPSKFIFQPRPLQQFDFGAGFRDLADTRMKNRELAERKRSAEASLGEQTAQRQDTNSLNSANFAKDRVNDEFTAATAKHTKLAQLVEQARQAGNANDTSTLEAMGPSILEMGGTYRKETGPDGSVNYVVEAGDAPARGALDVQGSRSQIYGGGPARQSSPFSMPGLGKPPGVATGNPFESLPGASAAALGQPPPAPPAAAPPQLPGGAPLKPEKPPTPPIGAQPEAGSAEADLAALAGMGADTTEDPPEDAAAPPAEGAPATPGAPAAPGTDPDLASLDPESAAMAARIDAQLKQQGPAPVGAGEEGPDDGEVPAEVAEPQAAPSPVSAGGPAPQNPYNPPAFSPYRLSMGDISARNQAQNQPLQQAFEEASPVGFRGRAEAFNRNIARAGMSPDRTKALAGPLLDKATDMYRTEVGADLAGQRMANTRDRQQEISAQRNSDAFFKRKKTAYDAAFKTSALADVKTLNVKQRAARDVEDLIKTAGSNGQSAYQLIGKLHDMADKGIMTKDDYSQATEGQVSWLTAFLRGTERKLIQEKGLDPDSIQDIIDVAKASSKRMRSETYGAMDKIYSQYKGTRDAAERAGYAQAMRGTFDAEYLPPDIGMDEQEEDPGTYQPGVPSKPSTVNRPPSGESLGNVPLPGTLDGKPSGKTPSARGSRVPEKPPRKPPATKVKEFLE